MSPLDHRRHPHESFALVTRSGDLLADELDSHETALDHLRSLCPEAIEDPSEPGVFWAGGRQVLVVPQGRVHRIAS